MLKKKNWSQKTVRGFSLYRSVCQILPAYRHVTLHTVDWFKPMSRFASQCFIIRVTLREMVKKLILFSAVSSRANVFIHKYKWSFPVWRLKGVSFCAIRSRFYEEKKKCFSSVVFFVLSVLFFFEILPWNKPLQMHLQLREIKHTVVLHSAVMTDYIPPLSDTW